MGVIYTKLAVLCSHLEGTSTESLPYGAAIWRAHPESLSLAIPLLIIQIISRARGATNFFV